MGRHGLTDRLPRHGAKRFKATTLKAG